MMQEPAMPPTVDLSSGGPSAQDEPTRRSRFGREAAIAIGGLGLLIGVVAAYVVFSAKKMSTTEVPVVAAQAWLSAGAASTTPDAKPLGPSDTTTGSSSAETTDSGDDTASSTSPDSDPNTRHGALAPGVAVITSLTRLGLSMADAHALITALDGVFDFRKARPGESFSVRIDPQTKEPQYFRYEVSVVEIYEVERQGNALVGRRKNIPTRKTLRRFGGTISSSLYKALSNQNAGPSLTAKVVEVLSNRVDFYVAQRPGDTFRLLVEEESLADTLLGYGPVLALEYSGVKSGKKRFFRYESSEEATYYDEKGISLPRSVLAIPVSYSRISSTFGMRFHPILRHKKFHNGVDFAAPPGTPVWAAADGTVRIAGNYGANGNLVVLDHGEGLSSCYAHLLRFAAGIKTGAKVKRKQAIGQVGNTGRSTGPHLHYGLKQNGRFIDPLKYKIRPGTPPIGKDKTTVAELMRRWNAALDAMPIRPPSEPLIAQDDEDRVMGDADGEL
ncbi:MAG: M23 family metallopeptidase [Myxococcota bacterium]|jgi:murein DD-endopeptidase MepM/ murein hydrolase activator NlpD|nr:M23 family metallopeptidase [Myxococcota bacterium]